MLESPDIAKLLLLHPVPVSPHALYYLLTEGKILNSLNILNNEQANNSLPQTDTVKSCENSNNN